MQKNEFYKAFGDIYKLLTRIHISKSVMVNFSVPKNERDYIFAYCLNEVCIYDYKGELYTYGNYNEDECDLISFNPRILKMDEECLYNTIAHELIHTVKGCNWHNSKFNRIAGLAFRVLSTTPYKLKNRIEFNGTEEETKLLQKLGKK